MTILQHDAHKHIKVVVHHFFTAHTCANCGSIDEQQIAFPYDEEKVQQEARTFVDKHKDCERLLVFPVRSQVVL